LLLLFFFPIALENRFFRFLNHPVLLLLGEISYSIYLLHAILLYFIFSVCFPKWIDPSIPPVIFWSTMPMMAILTVIISFFSYALIEKPCMRWGKRLAS